MNSWINQGWEVCLWMWYEEFAIIFHIVENEYHAIEFKKQTVHIFSEQHMWEPMDHIKDFQATFFERTGRKGLCTGNGKQSCAGEVEGYMLSHDCESRRSFLWVWCVLAVALSLIFTAEDYWEWQFGFGH